MPRENDTILDTDRSHLDNSSDDESSQAGDYVQPNFHLTYREWHAFVNGGYIGLVGYPERGDINRADKHYWRGGFLLGWSLKVVGILTIGSTIIN